MKSILASFFISEIYIEDAGLITITNVEVSQDLKIAKIFISFLDNKKSTDCLLKEIIFKKKIIRHYLSNKLPLKYIPSLRFYYDDSIKYAENINNLLNKLNIDDK